MNQKLFCLMFYYFYDSFLNERKYERILAGIEARIIALGIDGKKRHLNILKDMTELVKEAIREGAKTIVAIGNDKTFSQMVNIVAELNVTLGFIPLGKPNKISKLLGIPPGEIACDILSNRLTETVDLGKVNHSYFFSSLKIAKSKVIFKSEEYQIVPLKEQEINISNFDDVFGEISNPRDGFLELAFFPLGFRKHVGKSFFSIKEIKIESQIKEESVIVIADQSRILKTPLSVKISPQKLKVIVGRKRKFKRTL